MKIESISYIIISAFISYIYFMLESISNYNLGKDKQTFKWPFRTIDRTKSLYIDGEQIVLKSPFIADIVNKVKKRKTPSYYKGIYQAESKEWAFDYNEPNVEFMVNLIKGMNFNIDQKSYRFKSNYYGKPDTKK